VPTPVGPAPRDPNDPDFWDWSGGEDDGDAPRARRSGVVLVAVLLLVALVFMLVIGRL
jgi:hypothetical protein